MTDQTSQTVLNVEELCFDWPQGPLFERLSFRIPPGVSQIRGADGCGKSTLLTLLAGAIEAREGRLAINGIQHDENPDAYRRQVFWIDPNTQAHHALTPLAFWDLQCRLLPGFKSSRVAGLSEGFSLQPHLEKPMYMLSTGSRRKVWWVAAFAADAPLTLMDQPFAALDGPSSRFLRELLQEASEHERFSWLLADHEAPDGVPLKAVIDL